MSGAPFFDQYPSSQTTIENVPLTFSSQNNNALVAAFTANDVGLGVASGKLTLSTTSGLTFINGTTNGSATVEFKGSVSAMNAALNGLVFTPSNGFTGSDPLTFITAVTPFGLPAIFTTNTIPLTVTPVAPSVTTPAAASPNPVTGTTTRLSVRGSDDEGESHLTYTWATTGTPPAAVTFSANGSNSGKNITAIFTQPGSYNFAVTITNDSGLSTSSPVSVTVNQTLTTITVSPAGISLNENQTQQLSAVGYDQFGNAMTTPPTFTWSKTSGVGSINSSGLYTAPGGTGSASVSAASGYVSGSALIRVTNAAPAVASAAVASPGTVTGTSTALSVLGADDGGEANLTYSWSVLTNPAGAAVPSFSLNASNAAKNTTATFGQAGTYVLQATIADAGGLSTTSSVSVTVDQTMTNIAVSPASTSLAAGGTQQYSATALDQFGMGMAVQPSFTWGATDGVIDSTGLYTAPPASGQVTVGAASGAFGGSTTVTIVGSNTAIASPSTVTGHTTTLLVSGGATSGVTYTWSILTQPSGAANPTFSANASSAAQTTTAMFFVAGNYMFQVAIASGVTTTQTVAVTVNQTLTSIVVSPGTSGLNENGRQAFSAVGFDQFGQTMLSQPSLSWAVSSSGGTIDGSGLYTAAGSNGAGSATISATSGAVSGLANITVTNAAPTIATAAAAPSTVSGTTAFLSVVGADDGGESNLIYTWSIVGTPPAPVGFSVNTSNAAKDTTASFTHAGNYQFLVTVTDAEGLSVTSSVSVTVNQTLMSLALSPASATVVEGASRQFTATGTDQFGNLMSTPSLLWSVRSGAGSIDNTGLYTAAATSGTTVVSASSGAISATATLTIPNEPPTVAIAAAASPNSVTGTSTALSVLGADDGGESNLTYTWSTTGTPPAPVLFSVNGANAAKNVTATFSATGSYDLLVTLTDVQGASTSSSVNVIVEPVLAAVSVTPADPSLGRGQSMQFSAAARDQFGALLASQRTFVWSTIGNVGSIDGSGSYTAPDAGNGAVTVVATTGNVSGTATLNLDDDLWASAPASVSTMPGARVVFAGGDSISVSDGDPDTNSVPVSITVAATHGTISLSGTSGLNFLNGTENNSPVATFSGTIADVNKALLGMTYSPQVGFEGDGSVTVTINEVGTGKASPSYPIAIDASAAGASQSGGGSVAPPTNGSASNGVPDPTSVLNTSSTNPAPTTDTPSTYSGGIVATTVSFGDVAIDAPISSPPSPVAPVVQAVVQAPAPPEAKPAERTPEPAPQADNAPVKVAAAPIAMPPAPIAVPDVRVESVPERVFPFLAPRGEMSKEMDAADDKLIADHKLKVVAGSATFASFGASAAYLVWILRGGSLLSSLLSILPAWQSIDPLPVLDNFESRKRRKSRIKSDVESLESMVDQSNSQAEHAQVDGEDSTGQASQDNL